MKATLVPSKVPPALFVPRVVPRYGIRETGDAPSLSSFQCPKAGAKPMALGGGDTGAGLIPGFSGGRYVWSD